MSNFKKMGDRELYDYCREVGTNAHKYKRMLCAAIPEVFKRGLHRKYGFGSIHEFGAKIGGLSHNTVNEAIRVNEKLKDKPKLQSLIKDVGLNKLIRVANVATKENEAQWAKDVQQLSKAALEIKVKESLPGQANNDQLSLAKAKDGQFPFSTFSNMSSFKVDLKDKTIQELRILKANMKPGTTWDDVFKTLLKGKLSKKQRARGLKVEAKKICEAPGCNRPATEIHHKIPWAITHKHQNLVSLCKAHHELEHQSDSTVDKKFRAYKLSLNPL